MNCDNCCQKYIKQEVQINEEETKVLYVNTQKILNTSSVNSMSKRIRDQKTSLKRNRLKVTMNKTCTQKYVSSQGVGNYNRQNINSDPERLDKPKVIFRKPQQYFLTQKTLNYFSQNNVRQQNQNKVLAENSQKKPINGYKINHSSFIIKKQNPLLLAENRYSLPYQFLLQSQPPTNSIKKDQPKINQNLVIKINGNKYQDVDSKKLVNLEQILQEQFQHDLEIINVQNKEGRTLQTRDYQDSINKDYLLIPEEHLQIYQFRASRSISGIKKIDQILCTKTESIKDSQSQSSQFSQIISHPFPNLNRKITNSDMIFINQSQQKIENFNSQQCISKKIQNKKGQYRKISFNN